jgi:phosphate:Na+ symporter
MDFLPIIFYVLGGLAVFIYGMQLLSDGLQKTAGNRLKSLLEKLTNNRLKGVAVGAAFTSIVQSSSLTTVTLVGLISGGVMTLQSAVPVIMGANMGTTITAQIIAFKVTQVAFPAMAIGLVLMNFRNKKYSGVGQIIMGFGLLFLGMILMSQGISPLKEEAFFQDFLADFSSTVSHT